MTENPPNALKTEPFLIQSRGDEIETLIQRSKAAFVLITVIARRARRTDCPITGLKAGEAFIGDRENYDMSPREYRTAKKVLNETGLATFKTTNKGTIAKISNTAIYDINKGRADKQADKQNDKQETNEGQARDKQETTNKKDKKDNTIEEIDIERERSARPVPKWPTLAEVQSIASMRGILPAEAEAFFYHFDSAGWIDKNSNPVMNWESKLQSWVIQNRKAPQRSNGGKPAPNGGNFPREIKEGLQLKIMKIEGVD